MITATVPDLTDSEAEDIVLLRKEYGIGAREAWTVLPSWEVHLLLGAARPHVEMEEDESEGSLDAPPEGLDDLLQRGRI